MEISLYIHIPFCTAKCRYCDFVSFSVKDCKKRIPDYVTALGGEMRLLSRDYGPLTLDTVYFGGGTPSVLPGDFFEAVFRGLTAFFILAAGAEITLEANPETLDESKLQFYRRLGINRLSIGAQAASDRLLREMGRRHTWEDVTRTVRRARRAGFDNLGLDLIYGLPGQNLTSWRQTLGRAAALEPNHLSLYGLKLSAVTPWGRLLAEKKLQLPGEDDQADMYQLASEYLENAGYEHYEISNFALKGFQARHNLAYWRMQPYLGIGVAAASFKGRCRWTNTASLDEYIHNINKGVFPRKEYLSLTVREEMAETMIMGLRLAEGVSRRRFQQRFGLSIAEVFGEQVKKLTNQGLLTENHGRLSLTKGAFPIANEVFVAFV